MAKKKFFKPKGEIRTSFIFPSRPRSPTARVYVAAGVNIIWNSFLLMAKCRGDGREPSQRA